MSLSKTLYSMISTGSAKETSLLDCKIVQDDCLEQTNEPRKLLKK